MSTVLVTGGAGFIGTHLCRKLSARGHHVRVVDLKQPPAAIVGVSYLKGDVRDSTILSQCLPGVDFVYHLAATVSVPVCQKDPIASYSNNFSATLNLLERLRILNLDREVPIRFAFASTAALYGARGDDGRALSEEDVAEEFMSYYAAQKHASEQVTRLYRSCHGIPAMIFRFFNVFGPGQDPGSPYSGVITLFARLAREGKTLHLNGGGQQTRDFVSVHDLADACARAMDLPADRWVGAPINLGTGRTTTIRALADLVIKISGSPSAASVAPPREADVIHSKANFTRARQLIDFTPMTSLETGLRELLAT